MYQYLGICRDDLHNIVDDEVPFKRFGPDWKTSVIWKEWTTFGIKCFSQQGQVILSLPHNQSYII